MNWIIYQNVGLGICRHLWVLTSRGHLWGSCLEMTNQNPYKPKDFACLCPGQWRDSPFSAAGEMCRREYFGHLMWRPDSFEKILMLGKIEGRATEDEMIDGITKWKDMSLSKLQGDSNGQGSLMCCSPWGSQRVGRDLANWTTTIIKRFLHNKIAFYFHLNF